MAQLQRENAMLKTGVDLESPLGKFFVETYTGDPGDIEGLKAKAAELGIPVEGQVPAATETQGCRAGLRAHWLPSSARSPLGRITARHGRRQARSS